MDEPVTIGGDNSPDDQNLFLDLWWKAKKGKAKSLGITHHVHCNISCGDDRIIIYEITGNGWSLYYHSIFRDLPKYKPKFLNIFLTGSKDVFDQDQVLLLML